jgi:hypothetical protein
MHSTRTPDFTDYELEQISKLAGWGLDQGKIASIYRMSKATFYNITKRQPALREALDRGYAIAESEVARVAFEMATKGNNTQATMFWLKCRAGWKETQVQEVKQSTIEDLVNGATQKEEAKLIELKKKAD